ncbi:MAG: thioredoxin family protein [Tidjanibacter sp.]|nr:thioredoxin family protein [Tidjanibacter sp.]
MKFTKILLVALFSLFSTTLFAQQQTRTAWSAEVESLGEGYYNINVTANVPEDLHIYAMGELGGYNPTVVTVESENITLEGEVIPSREPHKYYDDIFMVDMGDYSGEVTFTQKVAAHKKNAKVAITVEWQECTDETCQMGEVELSVKLGKEVVAAPKEEATVAPASEEAPQGNFWAMIIEAILWGFAALLTPCVFPMVPMTVSFFMKGSENKAKAKFRAIMYGVFIVALYTLPIAALILITRIVGGDAVTADIFNWLATHWLPNIVFFIVFMIFAASFFGAFEIVLPSKLVNKSDENVDKKKGLGGVFFLALTLVLVSFSCTGPIVGSVLIKATQGEIWTPIFAMMAFSMAFAIPFVLCALFPGLLNKMPKSGGWLNSVKVVLGFVEVALGLKFLSTADQVYHWGLLDREIYLAIWIVCFTLLGFYLLGKLKFKHDSEVKYISTFRLFAAIGVFAFVVYMIPGMWGAPLRGLSGYMPPMQSQDFVIGSGSAVTTSESTSSNDMTTVKYGDFLELPLGLEGFFDLDEAKAYAAKVGKPIFVDFTGHGCVNCREMEARVWSDPTVKAKLENDFVICALYVDDKKQVAKEDWVTTSNGKVLKTLGKINSAFALEAFGANAQPHYVILDAEGKQLGDARGYNLDVPAFVEWMDAGKAMFNK